MPRLFISQERLDRLAAEERVTVEGDRCLITGTDDGFQLLPAVYFTGLVDGDDRNDLVGRVKSEEWLRGLGADLLLTSAIVGEAAYECLPGFLGGALGPEHGTDDAAVFTLAARLDDPR